MPASSLLIATVSTHAWGQTPRVGGVSIERFYVEEYRFITVNYRRTDLRENEAKAGLDLAIGLAPLGLAANTAVIQLEGGFARAMRVGPGSLVLRGGGSSFIAVGQGMAILPGIHGGFTAILPLEKQARLRVDVTRHFYVGLGDGQLGMWSIGLGFAVLSPTLNP